MSDTSVVEELARDDVERKRFLKMAGKSIGSAAAASGLAAFIAACGSSSSSSRSTSTAATAAAPSGDLAILNFALTLEYLETEFYKVKAKEVRLSGEAKGLAAMFADQEQEHVGALTQAVKAGGGTPVKKPTFVFPATDQASFLALAYVLENTGVGAYNGAGPALTSPQLLTAAGSIVQVEARHAAAIGLLTDKPVTPSGGFDASLTKAQVLAKAGPLIK